MPTQGASGKPMTRRYTDEEKAQAVRLVRQLRAELRIAHGTIQRIADQLGYGVESVRAGCDGPTSTPARSRA
jgi:transposase